MLSFLGRIQNTPSELLDSESKRPEPAVKESGVPITPLVRSGEGVVLEADEDFVEIVSEPGRSLREAPGVFSGGAAMRTSSGHPVQIRLTTQRGTLVRRYGR